MISQSQERLLTTKQKGNMLEGAILKSSVELITEIIENKKKPKLEIKNFFKRNRFAGAKDKRLIQEIVFKYL